MVQISTGYGQQPEGAKTLSRSKYIEISPTNHPAASEVAGSKTCRYTKEALITDGIDKGEVRKVCANLECPIDNPKKVLAKQDEAHKADQRRREKAIAATAGMRVLAAIASAIPVRLMKSDLLFVAERLLPMLDERRLTIIGRGRGIRAKGDEAIGKLLMAYAKKGDEGTLGKLIVETVILLSVRSTTDAGDALKFAARTYKVDNEAILRKVQREFAMKEKARKTPATPQKQTVKPMKAA